MQYFIFLRQSSNGRLGWPVRRSHASASALTQDRFAAQCVLIQVRHTDQTITDRCLSGHTSEKVKVSVKFQCKHKSLSPYIKDERLCAFRYPSRYFLPSLRFLAQRALASRESFFLAARLIVGLVPLACTATLFVGTSARR